MSAGASSSLTVVLASRTGLGESGPAIRHLKGSVEGSAVELLLVAPVGTVDPDRFAEVASPLRARLLEVESVEERGAAAAVGVLSASTEYVALIENHSFAEPGALEAMASDRDDLDAAVCPAIRTANPESLRSLAMYLFAYGHSAPPLDDRPRSAIPHHNSVFQTTILRSFGSELPKLMAEEGRLHDRLIQSGYHLRFSPDRVTWHINEARWLRQFTDPFVLGCWYGRSRAQGWGMGRRLLYVLAFPLIALLRWRDLFSKGRAALDTRSKMIALAPLLTLHAALAATGEAWGYVHPRTKVSFGFVEHEFHVRGRLAGIEPSSEWLRALLEDLPTDVL